MDELNLFNLFDMRFAFQNTTRINEQVALWKNRTTLLSWYTADEPDGKSHRLNYIRRARQLGMTRAGEQPYAITGHSAR